MSIVNIGRNNHNQSRNRTLSQLDEKLFAQQNQQCGWGYYQGFSGGTHTIKTPKGRIISGKFLSNSGAMVGDVVWWVAGVGQTQASFMIQVRG
ncbi:MAG TPA: hypothetical protein V6D10_07045 [Trichocoleus sp.]|jgi:hypothetical protein